MVDTLILKAIQQEKPKIIVLPECFNCPYGIDYFNEYSEEEQGPSYQFLKEQSLKHSIIVVGGSMPEKENGKVFNTCYVFENGQLIGKHRKVHLFDIDIPNKITFQESKVLSAGNQCTTVDSSVGKIGIGICYDIRFPELQMISARQGAFLLCYPGAFNTITGPLHWNILMQSRAIDNQVFVAACAPALDTTASYHSYGHSVVVDPMGKIITQAGNNEETIFATIDMNDLINAKMSIPVSNQRRFDVYTKVE